MIQSMTRQRAASSRRPVPTAGVVRLLAILALALFVGQAIGLQELIDRDDCVQSCPGDDANGDCPLGCQSCTCCPSTRPVLVTQIAVTLPSLTHDVVRSAASGIPPSPDPKDILHIPKRILS
jgi:hypothetical protein